MTRTFTATQAIRRSVPVLMGLYGCQGSGKTLSALRVATGMQRVTGKQTFVIDSENGRALAYADNFKFMHVPFDPPFGSDAYLAAINHCISQGAGQIIIDSGSHEHEGEGGYLDLQETLVADKAGNDWKKREKLSMWGWQMAQKPRNKLRQALGRSPVHQLWCFRAKNKIKPADKNDEDRNPKHLGMMPIGGQELLFEMSLCGLLMPGADGVPTWQSNELGERLMIKRPQHFRELISALRGPLDENFGEALARWGAGDTSTAKSHEPKPQPVLKFHPDYDQSLAGMALSETSPTRVLDYIEWLRPNENPKAQEHLRQVEAMYERMLDEEGAPGSASAP